MRRTHSRNKTGIFEECEYVSPITVDARARWKRLSAPGSTDLENIERAIVSHAKTTLARTQFNVDAFAMYQATAHALRDNLIHSWNNTQQYHTAVDPKRVYYLSLEFLIGRSLDNTLLSINGKQLYTRALEDLSFRMEDVLDEERDPALGNGGLGRLAACILDSLATQNYPCWGYGLRYTYGIFRQAICGGGQTEFPDYWLSFGNPWEIPRLDVVYDIRFYGHVTKKQLRDGSIHSAWVEGEIVEAVAYDLPICGFGTDNTINIRLWSSKPRRAFDLASFNEGDYQRSVDEQQRAENITSVLYPNDATTAGKELRLKQQYFFSSATLQDIIRRFKKTKRPWKEFPTQVSIQLNDTHPTLSIPELMRLLVDEEGLSWADAWSVVRGTFSFTNHTILPEAMEKWPVAMMEHLLPRHMQIIYDINFGFLQEVERAHPNNRELLGQLSIIEEGAHRQVKMAHLAIVGSHTVNGVAQIHTKLLGGSLMRDFIKHFGEKLLVNVTNGITPRRWLGVANPGLSALYTSALGGKQDWLLNLELLKTLAPKIDDPMFIEAWASIKRDNKRRLAGIIRNLTGVEVDENALFDMQVKRIHEYKRQTLNILAVAHRFFTLRAMDRDELEKVTPRVVIFGGKAAPGYQVAKMVIRLILMVASTVNSDESICGKLKVVFIPDYSVSLAERIVPANDISQHISTAGTEASGTSNMKFVLNGGLILGTLDGANIEIGEEIGMQNMFVFGCTADETADIRHRQLYRGAAANPKVMRVIDSIRSDRFGNHAEIAPLLDTLRIENDHYLVSHDFDSYIEALQRAETAFEDGPAWHRRCMHSAIHMGKFSIDRTVRDYARDVWKIRPVAPMQ